MEQEKVFPNSVTCMIVTYYQSMFPQTQNNGVCYLLRLLLESEYHVSVVPRWI